MNQNHRSCYGTLFHSVLDFTENEPMLGKVFGFKLDRRGLARSNREITANIEEWDDCLKCPEFDHCYKFSMAKLALEAAIQSS